MRKARFPEKKVMLCLTWSTCGISYILPKLCSHKEVLKKFVIFVFSLYENPFEVFGTQP